MKLRIVAGMICLLVVIISCENDSEIEFKRYYTGGQALYKQKCQNCHGEKGEGLSALFPPLTDSVYLKANKNLLACYISNGINQKVMIVAGKTYIGNMPAADLAPIEVAKVITYVTNSFGNKSGTVNVDMVNADLAKCK